ncbi:MAG: tetratricopeptide repeat protein [Planctomycetales bacterium]|nr:tetratricopeptide repeat protein [Planctomycetales bacterium]
MLTHVLFGTIFDLNDSHKPTTYRGLAMLSFFQSILQGPRQGMGRSLVAAALLGAAWTSSSALPSHAQELTVTVEDLVGSAVSLSNRTYPEIEDAIKRFRNNDAKGAREYLELAKQKYPKLPPTDVTMAKLFFAARNTAAAHQFLEKAAVDFPADPEAYLLVADRAFAENRTIEADALFEKAAEIVSKFDDNQKRRQNFDIRVLAGKSAVLERRRQWEEAIDLLRQWVDIDPDSPTAHQRLGVTLFRTGKAAEAFEEFKAARKVDPKTAHPYVLLGQLFTQEGNVDKARTAYQQAYKEDKDDDSTARAYAEWLLRQNDLDAAQKVASAMRQKSPDNVTALLLDGVISRMQGNVAAAEEAFMKVLSLEPSNVLATDFLALILADSDKVADQEKALSYAQINAQRFPNQTKASVTLAWVLYRLNRPADGGQVLQRALKMGAPNADAGYLIARILLQQNQKDEARKILDSVLQQIGDGMMIYRNDAEKLLAELGPAAE